MFGSSLIIIMRCVTNPLQTNNKLPEQGEGLSYHGKRGNETPLACYYNCGRQSLTVVRVGVWNNLHVEGESSTSRVWAERGVEVVGEEE